MNAADLNMRERDDGTISCDNAGIVFAYVNAHDELTLDRVLLVDALQGIVDAYDDGKHEAVLAARAREALAKLDMPASALIDGLQQMADAKQTKERDMKPATAGGRKP